MRYLFDNHRNKMKTPVAHAYLGGALTMMGDKGRAKASFETAERVLGYEDNKDYYQSSVRDLGGVIAAVSESGRADIAIDLAKTFRDEILDETYLHTQEKAYIILALKELISSVDTPKVSAQNATLTQKSKTPSALLYGNDLTKNPTFKNRDNTPIWATVTVSGAPADAPLPMAEGFTLSKQMFSMSGSLVEGTDAKQGDRYIVRVKFSSDMNRSRTAVLADLLPAGFEIETILRPEDGSRRDGIEGPYQWVGNISDFQVVEARDDRFIASLETYRKDTYTAAYIVRAVTPGDFAMPGAVVEDMYRPADRAITESGRIRITADPSL